MSMLNPADPLVITGVTFTGETVVEIGYMEKRNQTDNVGMMNTLFIDTTRIKGLPAMVREVQEILQEIVDAALVEMRNPEPDIDPRVKFRNRQPQVIDETSED